MRIGRVALFLVLVAAACSAGPDAAAPSIVIDSTDVSGDTVAIVVTTGEEGPVVVGVDWGDGTSEPGVSGTGSFAFEHTYDSGLARATISATATASDGSVAGDVAAVALDGGSSTTSLAALDTTTTTAATTTTIASTTTTVPPTTTTTTSSTTTTVPPTTTTTSTTQPPTTTVPTTTTTLPSVVEIDLDISKGKVFDQWGSGIKESTWNGNTVTAKVARHKDTWESDGIAVSFTIPASAYEDLKQGANSLEFSFVAYPLAKYRLDTDKLDGNQAELKWEFMGAFDTTWSSAARKVSAKAGSLTAGEDGKPFEDSWVLDSALFGTTQRVHLFFQCRAKGPGGLIVGSDSKCDASLKVNGIVVTVTANR